MLKRPAGILGVRGGQTTAEYAIIVALIAICSIGVILIFRDPISALSGAEPQKRAKSDQTIQVQDKSAGGDQKIPGSLDNR